MAGRVIAAAPYLAALRRIDATEDCEVTDWEASFLESLLAQQPTWLSAKREAICIQLVEKYLSLQDAAVLRGQQPLWPT